MARSSNQAAGRIFPVRIKLQVAIATVLSIITVCLIMRERTTAAIRQESYKQMIAAEKLQNDEQVLEAAENFFNNMPLMSKEPRTPQVMKVYTKSFVRWFAQQPETQLNEAAQKHLEEYRKLENTVKLEDKES